MKTTFNNSFGSLKFLAMLLAAGLVLWGCDQSVPSTDTAQPNASAQSASSSPGIAGKTGPEKHEARDKLEETAQTLATLAPNSKMFASIRKALKVREKRGYREDVSFAHLFKGSPKAAGKKAQAKYASASNAFRNGLHASLNKTRASMSKELRTFLVKNGVTVAWPYREKFKNISPRPTITFHPLTEKAENEDITATGFKPVKGNGGTQYKEVEVSEAYVKENPTLIIRPCEVGPVSADYMTNYCSLKEGSGHVMATSSGISTAEAGATSNAVAIEDPGTGGGGGGGGDGDYGSGGGDSDGSDGSDHPEIGPEDKLAVKISSVQCKYDTDGFFSGGPDLNFRKADPKVGDDGKPDFGLTSIHVDFEGAPCDDDEWMSIDGSNWDGLWQRMDEETGMVVADEDKFASSASVDLTLSVEPKYSSDLLDVSGNGSVEATLEYTSDESDWFRGTFARAMFTGDPQPNWENCGSGSRNGRCIQGLGSNGAFTFEGVLLENR